MSAISRKVVREAIGAGLAANLPSAQAVYSYAKANFNGQSPVVRINSESSERPGLTQQGIRSFFRFTIEIWVLLSDRDGWTEQDAEDALDTLEHEIITWMTQNHNTSLWTTLTYDGQSSIIVAIDGGDTWLIERIPIRAEVYG
jgi:hypothetical protein